MHNLLKNVVAPEDVSVMHRRKAGTDSGKNYNEYVHEQKINNALAKNTKIVYITNKKVPKPLVKSDWRPSTVICICLLYTSPSPRDLSTSRMPSSA